VLTYTTFLGGAVGPRRRPGSGTVAGRAAGQTARWAVSAGGARCGDAKQRRACGPGPAPCRVQPHPAKTDRTREAIR
uniref:hypothetical protein n=1 Tax=Angelakisella sp. TaxID=1935177 RepID=UPI003FEFD42F